MRISHILLYCHGHASKQQVSFQTQGRTPAEKYKMLKTIYRKGSISYMSLNGLKDSEWDVKTLKTIQRVGGC
jgi:hypothetical protein